ncbi:MAG: Crp/Fnr family transcriptional regulator [Mucilaginibacter sp.]|uniref:Crp/Fnr family transcriptional regulator n=1 Tax=Mucilaginibacter sp. TaxID=1882438 RepID=UPI0031AD8D25
MNNVAYETLAQCFIGYKKELLTEMAEFGYLQTIKANNFLIRQGQYVRSLPIVLTGAIKVLSQENGTPFLLYYIKPGNTCVISFAHLFGQQHVDFSGVAEIDSTVLLFPVAKAREWLLKYPCFSEIILQEYQKRYNDLLHTTRQVICFNLEERLIAYLRLRAEIAESDVLTITHQHIADDLRTSREVISRLLKKLVKDNQICHQGRKIRVQAI